MTEADTLLTLQTIGLGLAALRPSDGLSRDDMPPHQVGHGDPENTYGLPEGGEISAELKAWFEKQKQAVLGAVPDVPTAPLPESLPDVTDWDDPMATAFTPLLSVVWDASGKEVMGRLGLDPDVFSVTSPHLKHAVETAALKFCESTNATTGKQLDGQLKRLKRELLKGLVKEGESNAELSKRVRKVFENAEKFRADRIAATESSRAYHGAQEAAAVESGVVAGFELLLSSDACPLCRRIATECKRQRLGKPFAVIGHNPDYSTIRHPPLHPNCQCSMVEVLTPGYGGPEDPGFRPTLIQPTAGDDYTPPAGLPAARPEPEKHKTPVKADPEAERDRRERERAEKARIESEKAAAELEKRKAQEAAWAKAKADAEQARIRLAEQERAKLVAEKMAAAAGPPVRPVGEALDVKAKGRTADAIRTAVAAIDKVHGAGGLKRIPVLTNNSTTANGAYAFRSSTGEPLDITISERGNHPALTAAHEVGHFLEGSAIPGAAKGRRHFRADPLFKEWVAAVVDSEAHKALTRANAKGHKYLDYLLRGDELWARAYAQYVATRSGDPRLLGDLDAVRASDQSAPRQWADDDFKPIAAAIDRMFETIGWRA